MAGYIGPIDSTIPLLLASVEKDLIYVLSEGTDGTFSLRSAVDLYAGNANFRPAYFNFSPSPSSDSKISGSFLNSVDSLSFSGGVLKASPLASEFSLDSPYAFWDQESLLSGTPYTMEAEGKSVPFPFSEGGSTTSVVLIPLQAYYGCSGTQGQATLPSSFGPGDITGAGIPNALEQLLCQSPGYTLKGDLECQPYLWTDLDFCLKNNIIPYCKKGSECGASCMGPCSSSEDSCKPVDFKAAACKLDPKRFLKGQWWKDWWFILLVSVVSLILIVVIVLIVLRARKGKKEKMKQELLFSQEKEAILQGIRENVSRSKSFSGISKKDLGVPSGRAGKSLAAQKA